MKAKSQAIILVIVLLLMCELFLLNYKPYPLFSKAIALVLFLPIGLYVHAFCKSLKG